MLDRVKQLCKERHITVAMLNDTIGWSHNAIGRWKTNSPSIDKVLAVAEYFGVSVDYICGRTDIKETASKDGLPDDVADIVRLIRADPRLRAYLVQQLETYTSLFSDSAAD